MKNTIEKIGQAIANDSEKMSNYVFRDGVVFGIAKLGLASIGLIQVAESVTNLANIITKKNEI